MWTLLIGAWPTIAESFTAYHFHLDKISSIKGVHTNYTLKSKWELHVAFNIMHTPHHVFNYNNNKHPLFISTAWNRSFLQCLTAPLTWLVCDSYTLQLDLINVYTLHLSCSSSFKSAANWTLKTSCFVDESTCRAWPLDVHSSSHISHRSYSHDCENG